MDGLHAGSRIGSFKALDEVLARVPARISRKRAGRDLNPLNLTVLVHILRTGSRMCIGPDEVVARVFSVCLPIPPQRHRQAGSNWRGSNPHEQSPCTPTGSRDDLNKVTDEVCETETFRRSPIELRPTELQIGPVGLETHNLRVMNHVLRIGSRSVSIWRRRGNGPRRFSTGIKPVTRVVVAGASFTGLSMDSRPAVAVFSGFSF